MRHMRGLRIAAVFVVFVLTISIHNSFGQSGLPDDCARTAQMDIYSNAQVSEVTGDLSGFELALGNQIESRRKALLFLYEGSVSDGIPLTATINGGHVLIQGTWVEHLTGGPSKKDIVQKHLVRLAGRLKPKMLLGAISIEGFQIANRDQLRLKRVTRIWACK